MKPSKHIDRMFQESFKDFQESPSPKVWKGIEKKLAEKKRKNKIIPFWWKAVSIAAMLALFFSIGFFYQNKINTQKSISTTTSLENPNTGETDLLETLTKQQYGFSSVNYQLLKFENNLESLFTFQLIIETEETEETLREVKQNRSGSTRLAQSPVNASSSISFASLVSNSISTFEVSKTIASETSNSEVVKKKSIFDVIEEENNNIVTVETKLPHQWEIQPNVAPVFMNSFNGGNAINEELQGKTSSNANVSYGVNVAYAINKKVKIRTGVNQVAMGYNTQDVILSTTSSSFRDQGFQSDNFASKTSIGNVSLINANSIASPRNQAFSESPLSSSEFSSSGRLSHELGFLEVPLEIEYALLDSKLGIHILGGGSTFLLNNNEIFFEEGGTSSNIGEADNVNDFSFSANFGIGFDYSISNKLSLNLEPKMIYQINTFQSNTTDFQPYFFGVYSGIKLKF
jgi:hypothetical protein